MSGPSPLTSRVAAIRRFSRFFTGAVGVLHEHLYDGGFSLTRGTQVRDELAQRPGLTATDIGQELGLDSGYLSRVLRQFTTDGLLRRDRSQSDGRQTMLTLTEAGRAAFAPLETASAQEIRALLAPLPDPAQAALVGAMGQIETLLGNAATRPWLMRQPRPGDIGWVVSRHGALYAEEYQFDARFEALVAKVAGAFLEANDPSCERCWIAERDGVNVGSIFLVRADAGDGEASRLLLVEPSARGAGIGRRLVAECVGFARQVGYQRAVLWTNDILTAARHLYVEAGFKLVKRVRRHRDFGPEMVGEDWELVLR